MTNVIEITKSSKRPIAHDERKAQKIINEIAENSDNVNYSIHARERMISRGFTYNDVLTILRDGVVRKKPRYNKEKRSWLYKIEFIEFEQDLDAGCVV